jgi:tetratricopeptide (TPR) repeat protein
VARREDQAIAFANAGRLDLAERLLRDQLKETPESSEAHRVLSFCLRARGEFGAALSEADEALRLAPDSAFAHLERGRALRALKRPTEAELEVRSALAANPTLVLLHAELAFLLVDRGAVDQAIVTARAGLRFDPTNHDCLCALGLALLRAHRVDEAHQVYADALADEPTRAHLHNDLGIVLLHLGDADSAAEEFREALRLSPNVRPAEANLQFAEQPNAVRTHPYTVRFNSAWRSVPQHTRSAMVVALFALGFLWPGGWGGLAYPLALETKRRLAIRTGARESIVFRTVLLTTIGLAFTFIAWSWAPRYADPGADASYIQTQEFAAWLQLATGVLLFRSFRPVLATIGRARAVAVATVTVAVLAASWGGRPGASLADAAGGALIALACAAAIGPLAFRVERSWQGQPDPLLDQIAER